MDERRRRRRRWLRRPAADDAARLVYGAARARAIAVLWPRAQAAAAPRRAHLGSAPAAPAYTGNPAPLRPGTGRATDVGRRGGRPQATAGRGGRSAEGSRPRHRKSKGEIRRIMLSHYITLPVIAYSSSASLLVDRLRHQPLVLVPLDRDVHAKGVQLLGGLLVVVALPRRGTRTRPGTALTPWDQRNLFSFVSTRTSCGRAAGRRQSVGAGWVRGGSAAAVVSRLPGSPDGPPGPGGGRRRGAHFGLHHLLGEGLDLLHRPRALLKPPALLAQVDGVLARRPPAPG